MKAKEFISDESDIATKKAIAEIKALKARDRDKEREKELEELKFKYLRVLYKLSPTDIDVIESYINELNK